jgi:peptidoglycan/xylan/chitin deacetylase (PgdA/CDA1 family)
MVFRTPFFLPWLYPGLLWRVPTTEKKVFITFDDGPVPGPTEFVLELLRSHQVKATFFCIGDNVRKHPQIFRKLIEEGHQAGNHTFHHMRGWKHSTDDYLNDTAMCDSQMKESGFFSGVDLKPLFRPPYGRISRAQITALDKYKIVMWDVLTQDYDQSISPEKCLRGSIKATRPGSIVVFHDSAKALRNLEYALPRYLEFCKREGYSFGALQ